MLLLRLEAQRSISRYAIKKSLFLFVLNQQAQSFCGASLLRFLSMLQYCVNYKNFKLWKLKTRRPQIWGSYAL